MEKRIVICPECAIYAIVIHDWPEDSWLEIDSNEPHECSKWLE